MGHVLLALIIVSAAAGAPGLSVPAVAQQSPASIQQLTAEGLWEQIDENTGRTESWFRIYRKGDFYEGQLVKIFPKAGEDTSKDRRCEKCEGENKNAPLLGMALIKGMKRNGLAYEHGSVTDPRDGSVYRALMNLSPDNKTMEMRGYLGISLFGRSQIWKRLPNDAIGSSTASPARQQNQSTATTPRRSEQIRPAQPEPPTR
jgi:uncharacterized protein (DUF2147 family)